MSYSGNDWYDSPELLQVLQSKLPLFLQDRWNRQALKIRSTTKKEARLTDFISLIEKEVQLVTDPLYSREANNAEIKDSQYAGKPKGRVKSFGIDLTTPPCPCCNKRHDLDDCTEYLKKPLEERRKLVFGKRLCFSCYKPISSDHLAKSCTQPKKCIHCQKNHPSSLHGLTIKSACAHLEAEVISLCVVPVLLSHKFTGKVVQTYALLDQGSQGSFIKDELLKDLGVVGLQTSITVTTVTGELQDNCFAVDGLRVSNVKTPKKYINLPRMYTKSLIPVHSNDIAKPQRLRKWKYLERIHPYLLPDGSSVNVQLLLGGNCPSILEPTEVVKSRGGGPYAFNTVLGWCVSGPIVSKPSSKKCNLIAAKDVSTNQLSAHHFVVQDEVQEDSLKHMLQKMYHQEFNEQPSNSELEYSV